MPITILLRVHVCVREVIKYQAARNLPPVHTSHTHTNTNTNAIVIHTPAASQKWLLYLTVVKSTCERRKISLTVRLLSGHVVFVVVVVSVCVSGSELNFMIFYVALCIMRVGCNVGESGKKLK